MPIDTRPAIRYNLIRRGALYNRCSHCVDGGASLAHRRK